MSDVVAGVTAPASEAVRRAEVAAKLSDSKRPQRMLAAILLKDDPTIDPANPTPEVRTRLKEALMACGLLDDPEAIHRDVLTGTTWRHGEQPNRSNRS